MTKIEEEKNIVLSDEEILEISHNIHMNCILDKDISEEEEDTGMSLYCNTTSYLSDE